MPDDCNQGLWERVKEYLQLKGEKIPEDEVAAAVFVLSKVADISMFVAGELGINHAELVGLLNNLRDILAREKVEVK